MKKIAIVVGTRPNFIKITQFEREFARYPNAFDYRLIHTGQHYDAQMSEVFFEQFNLKRPDHTMAVKGRSPAEQIAKIIDELTKYFTSWRPDLLIVVGDVNSTLAAAIAGNKNDIPLAHLESGLRSHDRGMPEEINRILTDSLADEYFVTEQSGVQHLQQETQCQGNIHLVGNTMIDTLIAFDAEIAQHSIVQELDIRSDFALMTMHRPQNVDDREHLGKLMDIIRGISSHYEIVFPMHPRTLKNLEKFEMIQTFSEVPGVKMTGPLNYLAFQKLIRESAFVITDSGGIQEETTFRQVPCLTLRPNTERPCTVDVGSNTLLDLDVEQVLDQIQNIRSDTYDKGSIPEFWDGKATARIVDLLQNQILM